MADRILIRGGHVLTLDPALGDFPGGDVLIEDGVIEAVAPSLDVTDAEIVDATDRIVLPGFVDTHRHTWQTPVRGVLPSRTLDEYFASMLGNIGTHYRPEDVYAANLGGARWMLSTPASRRCSTGRTSTTTRPSTRTRRSAG